MEFLINNPVIAFALLVVLGFTTLMITKLFEEVKLNNLLSIKQKQMRISSPVKSIKGRIAYLSSAALAPVVAVVVMVSVALNPQIIPTGDLLVVESSNDIIELYSVFQERINNDYQSFDWRKSSDMEAVLEGGIIGNSNALTDDLIMYEFVTVPTATLDLDALTSEAGSSDYSGTNNQVIGVDEMDNVLTDGKFIYTMYENKVQITLAYTEASGPGVLNLYKTFEFTSDYCEDDQFYPEGMYVDDNYLVIIGNQYTYNCDEQKYSDDGEPLMDIYPYWYASSSDIKVLVFDKTNDFELKDEYKMNGYFTGTRKIETESANTLYIVTNNYIPFYLDDLNVDDYLNQYEVNGEVTKAEYEDIVYVEGTSPNSFTTFYGIDLDTTEVDVETVLGDSGYNLYVSNYNMYLVGSAYFFLPMVDFIDTAEQTYENKTAILKISISAGEVEYFGSGYVEGYSLDQFSMDEHNGYLRITTTNNAWGEDINNRLFVLDQNLKQVAVLENLGKPRETIKSTRFVGNYAYVVTFEQTDPFYIINLSNPQDPFVEGELSMPGYSAYLQPLGENFVLGLGYGDNLGGTQGLKFAIYDVSDKTAPVELDNVTFDYSEFGWANSSAIYNHKDLLVSLDKGIIALPFNLYGYNNQLDTYSYNSGILVYNIDLETGFEYSGYVTHATDSAEDVYVYKSKFISDYFYTVSNEYIKVSTILDPETILHSTNLN